MPYRRRRQLTIYLTTFYRQQEIEWNAPFPILNVELKWVVYFFFLCELWLAVFGYIFILFLMLC